MACKHEGGTDPCVRGAGRHCKAQTKAYREANRGKKSAASKAWYWANREKHLESTKAWYQANRDKKAAMSKARYQANREYMLEQSKAWYYANRDRLKTPERALKQYKNNAKHRSYSWELTDAQALWLMQQPCAYCGETGGGIDRAKNEYGYTELNSVPCCTVCNYAKHTRAIKAFLVAVNQIARYCPDYPKFKRRWESIRKKLTKLGEQQDAAVSVPMHRVSRSNRKTSDVCGVPETPVVHMRGAVGSDAGMSSLV
jgi:hypothetical protein